MTSQLSTYHQRFQDWLTLRNYAPKTIESYLSSLRQYWRYCDLYQYAADYTKENAVQHYLFVASVQ